jgi:triacylglycerol lipase
MPLELIEDAKGDPRNALFLALACDLAYLPAAEGAAAFKEQLGLDARLIAVDNTQAYVGTNDDHLVVAFRGTEGPNTFEGLKDWLLTDAANLLMVPEGRLGTDFIAAGVGARFHMGFINALAEVWDPLFEAVDAERKKADRPFWITGHSLGGALANLAAWLFKRKFINVHQVYTFGAPMIGNAAAMQAFETEFAGKMFRYVSHGDPVPLLPTISLLANDYTHCPTEVALGAAPESGGQLQGLLGQVVEGMLTPTVINDLWAGIQKRVEAHFMTNYRNHLGKPS